MPLGKIYSVYSDLRTRKGALFFFVLGGILLILTVLQFVFHVFSSSEELAGILLALTMLFLGGGAIFYFFSRMFGRLAEIAAEVESDESLRDDEDETEERQELLAPESEQKQPDQKTSELK